MNGYVGIQRKKVPLFLPSHFQVLLHYSFNKGDWFRVKGTRWVIEKRERLLGLRLGFDSALCLGLRGERRGRRFLGRGLGCRAEEDLCQ